MRFNRINFRSVFFTLPILMLVLMSHTVFAGTLSDTYIRLNRMQTGTTTSLRLVFTTSSAGATSISIDFNGSDSSTWTGSSGTVNATQTVSSASCASETSTTALPGSITASGSGSTVTISSVTALSSSHAYCVDLTSSTSLTLPTAGEYHPLITIGSDTKTVALRTITNDQVVVSGTVPPAFNMAFNNNTADSFGTLSSGSVTVAASGHIITINTNAQNGWNIWATSANTGLNSASASHTIPSKTPGTATSLSAGTEGYIIGITNISQGSGSGVTSAGNYTSNGSTTGSGLDTTNRIIASSDGTANAAAITVKEFAAISGSTDAATDYTDTITFIGAGMF